MEPEPADDYIRRIAAFIRSNEKGLAETGLTRRRRVQRPAVSDHPSLLNPLAWFGFDATKTAPDSPSGKPVILSTDVHHLFYIFMRLEALGYDIGTLDVKIDNPSRPATYINIAPEQDKSDTLSLASIRSSLSAVSGLSIGRGWWGQPELPSIDMELKYIYSSITKLPALSIHGPEKKVIAEMMYDAPVNNALPLDSFKNIQILDCSDIDPRMLLGWDRLAESLRSLKITKSGLEDISDIFIGSVVDDQARREGSTSRKRRRRIPCSQSTQLAFHPTSLPETVIEDERESMATSLEDGKSSPVPNTELRPLKWSFLKHLFLPDNSLTYFPPEPLPYLKSLTHLDLSSNLLVSIPSGLSELYNLVSLNLSDNMIDSVLGIYLNLGRILRLNLSKNRLESICGLERLHALEHVDLRSNLIEESAEIGRLATLPNIAAVWVEGNPLIEVEDNYRVACFDYFKKEGHTVTLDGSLPGYYERLNLTMPPPEQMSSTRPLPTPQSPPVVSVGQSYHHQPPNHSPNVSDGQSTPPPSTASPQLSVITAVGKARQKKLKRIVEFERGNVSESGNVQSAGHSRNRSEESRKEQPRGEINIDEQRQATHKCQVDAEGSKNLPAQASAVGTFQTNAILSPSALGAVSRGDTRPEYKASRRNRHSRYQTEFAPSNYTIPVIPPFDALASPISTQLSSTSDRTAKRRARMSASVYEPPSSFDGGEDSQTTVGTRDSADVYRKRIEALKNDMGDGWLKVFSQSQMKSPS